MTLAELAIQEYEDLSRKLKIRYQPLYPTVLIRVLPKEHMQGGLWLPDTKQNKPVYEGIVLRVYPPKRIQLDSGKWITMDSGLSVGDHILFPHWSGESVPWLREALSAKDVADEEYRLIPARGLLSLAGMRDSGEPYLILNYEKESVDEKLALLLNKVYADAWDAGRFSTGDLQEDSVAHAIEQIKKDFDILVKVKASQTTSGDNRKETS
jgi:co-chaperonin GroES (HSP10)